MSCAVGTGRARLEASTAPGYSLQSMGARMGAALRIAARDVRSGSVTTRWLSWHGGDDLGCMASLLTDSHLPGEEPPYPEPFPVRLWCEVADGSWEPGGRLQGCGLVGFAEDANVVARAGADSLPGERHSSG